MNKKDFINSINHDDKDMLSNIYDKIIICSKSGRTTYTNEFYPPNVWTKIKGMENDFRLNIEAFGVFEEADRRMICFSYDNTFDYPVKVLKIHNKSKFENLEHKDFLGSVMALGIKREKFGDLRLNENNCYMPAAEEISEFIKLNLESVGRCPCEITILKDIDENIMGNHFEDISIICTSCRVDCIVGEICNTSRNKAVQLIEQGKVLIDYINTYDKDTQVKDGSVLTIRGYGKYKVQQQIGCTQKGRIKLWIKKYV